MLRLFQHRPSSTDPAADKPRHRRNPSDGTHETEAEELSTLSAASGHPTAHPPHHGGPGSISGVKDRQEGRRVELTDMPEAQAADAASTPVASGRKAPGAVVPLGADATPVVDLLGLRPYDHRSSPASSPEDDDGSDDSSFDGGGTADAHLYAAHQLASLSPSSSLGNSNRPNLSANELSTASGRSPDDTSSQSSLRLSTETNGLDSICTGDHVSAMLREYQGGGSRWDSSDRIGASYTAEMQANIFKQNKTLLSQIAEPDEVLTDTSDRPIRSRIQKKRRGKKSRQDKLEQSEQSPGRPSTPGTDDGASRKSSRSVDTSSLKTCDIPVDQESLDDKTGWDEEMAAESEPAHFAEVSDSPALKNARERAARKAARAATLGEEADDPHGLNAARLRARLEGGLGSELDGSRGGHPGGSPGRMNMSVHSASTAPVANTSDRMADAAADLAANAGGSHADHASAASGSGSAAVLMDNRSLEKLLWDNQSQDGAYSLNLTDGTEDGPMRNLAGAVKDGMRRVGSAGTALKRRASDAMAPAIVIEKEDVYNPTSGKLVSAKAGEATAGSRPREVAPVGSPADKKTKRASWNLHDDDEDNYNLSARLSALGGLPGFARKNSMDSMWSAFGRRRSSASHGHSEDEMETGEGSGERSGASSRRSSVASLETNSPDSAEGEATRKLGWGGRRGSGRIPAKGSGSDRVFVTSRGPAAGADSDDEENQNGHDADIDGALGNGGNRRITKSLLGNIRGASFQRSGRRGSSTPYVDEDGTTFDEYGDVSSLAASNGTMYRPGLRTIGRCCAVLVVLVVVAIASTLAGVLVPEGEGKDDQVAYIPIPPSVDTLSSEIQDLSMATPYSTSELKNMVVSVESHCAPTKMSSTTGSWECEQICHSHLCCFDPKGHGWCGGDMNKLCPIFKGCGVLAAPELAAMKEDKELEAKVEIVDILPSGEEKKEHNGDGFIANALPEEKDMGWLDIRRKRTSVYCSPSNLETINGRAQCHEVCALHFCCVDSDPDESCEKDVSKTCDVYESCRNYVLLEDRDSIRDGAFEGHTLVNIDGSEMDVDEWIEMNEDLPLPPGAPRPEGEDKTEKHLGYDMPDFDEPTVDEFGPIPGDDVMSDAIVPMGMDIDPDNIGSEHQNNDIVFIPGEKEMSKTVGKGTSGYAGEGYKDPMEDLPADPQYVPSNLPDYLTPAGFDQMSDGELEEVAKRSEYDWDELHEMKSDVKERCESATKDSTARDTW